MSKKKWYVGKLANAPTKLEAFQSQFVPTDFTHPEYSYVVGPFKTSRGAHWAEQYGYGNPHFTSVDAAERLAKQLKAHNAAELYQTYHRPA